MKSHQRSEVRGQGSVPSTQYSVLSTECNNARFHPSPHSPYLSRLSTLDSRLSPRGFTLVELLVTITIIGIMAGLVFGAVSAARNAAREAATKGTIAKLNTIIMHRYESYMTRRVPIQILPGTVPKIAALNRLYAIRELMRMEMPDCLADLNTTPRVYLPSDPPLYTLYRTNLPTANFDSAQCLYKVVSIGSPEAMENFNQNEIGTTSDGKPVFIDGWGNPICWLRWAPGCSSLRTPGGFSDIQTGDPLADSDPFDPRKVDTAAFHLIPLICSPGQSGWSPTSPLVGLPNRGGTVLDITNPCQGANNNLGASTTTGFAGIHNHHIEGR